MDVLLLQIQITGIVNICRVSILKYTSLGGQGLAGLSWWTGAGRSLLVDRGWPASLVGEGLAGLSLDRRWPASLVGQGLASLSCWTGAGRPLSLDRG